MIIGAQERLSGTGKDRGSEKLNKGGGTCLYFTAQ